MAENEKTQNKYERVIEPPGQALDLFTPFWT